jgi:hypothetical protein
MTDDTPLPFDLSAVAQETRSGFWWRQPVLEWRSAAAEERGTQAWGVRALADAMPDRREASRIRHAMFEMVMARVCEIACGHEDATDLDRLRHDPLMKVAVGRCPQSGAPLASQSTISRLENAPRKTQVARLTAALLDQFGTTIKPGAQEILVSIAA